VAQERTKFHRSFAGRHGMSHERQCTLEGKSRATELEQGQTGRYGVNQVFLIVLTFTPESTIPGPCVSFPPCSLLLTQGRLRQPERRSVVGCSIHFDRLWSAGGGTQPLATPRPSSSPNQWRLQPHGVERLHELIYVKEGFIITEISPSGLVMEMTDPQLRPLQLAARVCVLDREFSER